MVDTARKVDDSVRREKIVQTMKEQAEKLGKPIDIALNDSYILVKKDGVNWTTYLGKTAIDMWEGKLELGSAKKVV